ncbi:MAG: MerR family transcriptional regulator [Proteobacteria bacterium]|nr:MAG: MerR family transcriptional regulator [Pseudomonadota bacterium]
MDREPSPPQPATKPSTRRARPAQSDGADENAAGGKRYYRIGEVSRITGVKAHVLRYWESEFRWMAPAKSRSQQRLYRQRDIEVILLLKRLLHEERFTIAGARKRLRELGVAKALEAPQLDLGLEIDHASRYRRIREELEAIKAML